MNKLMNKLRCIDLDELQSFYCISEKDIMSYTIEQILEMNNKMHIEKEEKRIETTKNDAEFRSFIIKYFSPFEFLSKHWTEDEIVSACAKYAKKDDIVTIQDIPKTSLKIDPKDFAKMHNYEYIDTTWANVRQYTKDGKELLYGKRCVCHRFYAPNKYQGLLHGKIILELLYTTYPQLKEFKFEAYDASYMDNYEIYPRTVLCYTPLASLLSGDIDTIIKRNADYCKLYNNGNYTPEKWKENMNSAELQHYFNVIRSLHK